MTSSSTTAELPASGRRRDDPAGTGRRPASLTAGTGDALGQSLELDADASACMSALAALDPVRRSETEVAPDVHQLLDTWVDGPAYVRNRRFDVLAANKRARALAPMYEPGHDLARDMFLSSEVRQLLPE
ncbi:hypothetical protein [Streptomyces sp. NPDC048665]|uniref:MmyB family transcriptional regulator n=1 Tax=Streptomyces sp. NPDC048665 TaxID=3155490 RepID=UPI00342E3D95